MSIGAGASFIGQSGSCNPNTKYWRTYGEFDMVPPSRYTLKTYSMIGSTGKKNDLETGGGGRVVVYADSVHFVGSGDKI